ncbi:hypothetical protein [Streptomyces sp. NPDC050263]|uniref:hypothetical protein n=1 Tax=Streptomyces sp. NPDC050263 TaxID=3155037 RepID=UPI00342D16BA
MVRAEGFGQPEGLFAEADRHRPVERGAHRAAQQVDARRAHLLEDSAAQYGDPVAERHGLGLVVRDMDRGDAQLPGRLGDLGPQAVAALGVEVGRRLVHQKGGGVQGDGPARGDPLPLAAEELAGMGVPTSPALGFARAGEVATAFRSFALGMCSSPDTRATALPGSAGGRGPVGWGRRWWVVGQRVAVRWAKTTTLLV